MGADNSNPPTDFLYSHLSRDFLMGLTDPEIRTAVLASYIEVSEVEGISLSVENFDGEGGTFDQVFDGWMSYFDGMRSVVNREKGEADPHLCTVEVALNLISFLRS